MKHHPPEGAIQRARTLRREKTKAERALWRLLREHFAEWHFRRQVPIQHETEVDAPRSAIIEAEGYKVMRFWNNEVLGNREDVYLAIQAALLDHHPRPTPPHQGGGL